MQRGHFFFYYLLDLTAGTFFFCCAAPISISSVSVHPIHKWIPTWKRLNGIYATDVYFY